MQKRVENFFFVATFNLNLSCANYVAHPIKSQRREIVFLVSYVSRQRCEVSGEQPKSEKHNVAVASVRLMCVNQIGKH